VCGGRGNITDITYFFDKSWWVWDVELQQTRPPISSSQMLMWFTRDSVVVVDVVVDFVDVDLMASDPDELHLW